jgi:hypothetical protein
MLDMVCSGWITRAMGNEKAQDVILSDLEILSMIVSILYLVSGLWDTSSLTLGLMSLRLMVLGYNASFFRPFVYCMCYRLF